MKLLPEDQAADLNIHERIVCCHVHEMREKAKGRLMRGLNQEIVKQQSNSMSHQSDGENCDSSSPSEE